MNLQKFIVTLAYQWKAILLHFIPAHWLRKIKNFMVASNFKRLKKFRHVPYQKGTYPIGINLIGSIRAETGLGQSCRLLANEFQHCGYPLMIYNYTQIGNLSQNDSSWDSEISKDCCYSINLIHINPHELGIALMQLNQAIWDRHYNIGFWLWELEEFPDEWLPCLSCMDEIWTPSEFVSRAIRKKTTKPVITIPYAIEAEIDIFYGRKEFHLPENQFLFLMLYDSNSISERKNPTGVITAFQLAFSKEETGVGLVIKVHLSDEKELKQLQSQVKGYKNIYIITELLEKKKVNSLIACVDVVVSLHRAEGFGLVLAEAMFLGTPTIATNWSANTEFMDHKVACMVDYQLVELKKDIGPFKKGQYWAEANLVQAAEYMRKLYEDPYFYQKILTNAQDKIKNEFCMEKVCSLLNLHIKRIEHQ